MRKEKIKGRKAGVGWGAGVVETVGGAVAPLTCGVANAPRGTIHGSPHTACPNANAGNLGTWRAVVQRRWVVAAAAMGVKVTR